VSGARSYLGGLSAEAAVAARYQREGYELAASRWRGAGGEIDLILHNAEGHVFVEVKHASGFAEAAYRIGPRQQQRIMQSALAWLGEMGDGVDAPMRFDVALVDGQGRIEIIENAFP
jgi:putative endonuclease